MLVSRFYTLDLETKQKTTKTNLLGFHLYLISLFKILELAREAFYFQKVQNILKPSVSQMFPMQHCLEHSVPQSIQLFGCFKHKFVIFVVSKSNCAITLNRWTEFNRHCQFMFSLKDPHTEFVFWSFDSLCRVKISFPLRGWLAITRTQTRVNNLDFAKWPQRTVNKLGFWHWYSEQGLSSVSPLQQREETERASDSRWAAVGGTGGVTEEGGSDARVLEPHSVTSLSSTSAAARTRWGTTFNVQQL